MCEAAYANELRDAEAGGDGEWVHERDIFLGVERLGGSSIVMPALEEHVATKLAAKAQVLKERSKACGEAQFAREAAPGIVGDAGGGKERGGGKCGGGRRARRGAR